MTAWRPISEAPQDRDLLLWVPCLGCVRGRWNADQYGAKPRPYWDTDRRALFGMTATRANPPTHWQDLPDGPGGES